MKETQQQKTLERVLGAFANGGTSGWLLKLQNDTSQLLELDKGKP